MIESISQTDLSDFDLPAESPRPVLHMTVFPAAGINSQSTEVRPLSRRCSPIALRPAVNGEKRFNGGFSSRRRPVVGKMFPSRSGDEYKEKGEPMRLVRKLPPVRRISPVSSRENLANSSSDQRIGSHRLRTIRSKGGVQGGTPREAASGEVLSVTSLFSKKPILFHRLAIEFNSAAKIREVRKTQPRLRLLLYK